MKIRLEGHAPLGLRAYLGNAFAWLLCRPRSTFDGHVDILSAPSASTPYLDPPIPSLRPLAHPRYAPSHNSIPIPRPDTSRHTSLSFHPPPRAQAVPGARTMSMDPPTARRTSAQEPSYLPPPISRDVSMENLSAQPANPPFGMRSSLTPQPGVPLYGPNPQRRERNPSEPPSLVRPCSPPSLVRVRLPHVRLACWRRRGSPLPCRLWFGVLSFVSRVRFCLGFVLLLFLTRSC
jgi:hypothetical protein